LERDLKEIGVMTNKQDITVLKGSPRSCGEAVYHLSMGGGESPALLMIGTFSPAFHIIEITSN
jgi:hypothetical protein